ncbi:hypothetical protein HG535_0G00610 [Zygotorulaspora mrakii]|uniref:Uncharacterized protein n=1 Tax=Zygotorulaspora mrakii TaxID=42260 RepID=A0A7H9B6I0_ZYGMR|nr:uncharacterized protein HG535_0G00610 [Zygotorulaspora mrakii]QLG74177.1 hypothetical protein HG535_0G00610 [Zygotorulaspora mrakii]
MLADGHYEDTDQIDDIDNTGYTDEERDDGHLYERFLVSEGARQEMVEPPQEDENEELRDALNEMLETIEHEVQYNRRNRQASTVTEQAPATRGSTSPSAQNRDANLNGSANINPNRRREPLFVQGRPYLRTFVRNLLVLDYAFMIFLFPFSLYNIIRFGFSSMTLSNNDFVVDIMMYYHSATNFVTLNDAFLLKDGQQTLLYKFHNIVLYYSWPAFKKLLTSQRKEWMQKRMLEVYEFSVKSISIVIYLTYGIGGTLYLTMAGFFFSICLVVTIVRRYKNVQRMVAAGLESSAALPALF